MVRALAFGGADLDADAAAHAVQRRHGHGVLVHALALAGLDVHQSWQRAGACSGLFRGQCVGTDGGMGADIGAAVALDALVRDPRWERSRQRRASHKRKRPARTGRRHDRTKAETGRLSPSILPTGFRMFLTIFDQSRACRPERCCRRSSSALAQAAGTSTFLIGGSAGVDGVVVHLHDVVALLQVGRAWQRPSCSLMASSAGMTLARAKKADCRMVLVRLPMPISMARSMASMV